MGVMVTCSKPSQGFSPKEYVVCTSWHIMMSVEVVSVWDGEGEGRRGVEGKRGKGKGGKGDVLSMRMPKLPSS